MRNFGIALLFSLCALGAAQAQEWTEAAKTSKAPSGTYSAAFIDARGGVAVGYSGLAMLTADGGKSWDSGRNSSMCLFASQMLDASRCYATGNGGYVIVSKDGGRNWESVSSLSAPGRSISFASELRGWAATKNWLGETGDGGKNWSKLPLPEGVKKIETIELAPDAGYLVSQDGSVYRTRDSGATWEALKAPFPRSEGDYQRSYGNFAQTVGLSFEGQRGVAAAAVESQGRHLVAIKRTEDGGATWSEAEEHSLDCQSSSLTMNKDFISILGSDSIVTLFKRAR